MNCDSVVAYAFLTLDLNPEWAISKNQLYSHYLDWCKQNHYSIFNDTVFARKLRAEMPKIIDSRPKGDDGRVHVWVGVK